MELKKHLRATALFSNGNSDKVQGFCIISINKGVMDMSGKKIRANNQWVLSQKFHTPAQNNYQASDDAQAVTNEAPQLSMKKIKEQLKSQKKEQAKINRSKHAVELYYAQKNEVKNQKKLVEESKSFKDNLHQKTEDYTTEKTKQQSFLSSWIKKPHSAERGGQIALIKQVLNSLQQLKSPHNNSNYPLRLIRQNTKTLKEQVSQQDQILNGLIVLTYEGTDSKSVLGKMLQGDYNKIDKESHLECLTSLSQHIDALLNKPKIDNKDRLQDAKSKLAEMLESINNSTVTMSA